MSKDPVQILESIDKSLAALRQRLAPENPTQTLVKYNGNETISDPPKVIPLSGPWNTLYCNLSQGTIKVYFGSHGASGGAPDLVLDPSHNGVIPIGARYDQNLSFVMTSSAKGTVIVEFY